MAKKGFDPIENAKATTKASPGRASTPEASEPAQPSQPLRARGAPGVLENREALQEGADHETHTTFVGGCEGCAADAARAAAEQKAKDEEIAKAIPDFAPTIEAQRFRVTERKIIMSNGSLTTLAAGSIVSVLTHDLASLRTQNVKMEPVE
jgi:hypothetical protein